MTNRKPLIAILGCGPSGLLAAHACAMKDVPFVIFSRKVKSQLGGAQYSHIPIPGIHDPDSSGVMLKYRLVGNADTYRHKVYGDNPVPFVSMERVRDGDEVHAWNLQKMYDDLWDWYQGNIIQTDINWNFADRIQPVKSVFDLAFSSIPLPAICGATKDPAVNHWFKQQTIRIYNSDISDLPDNTIMYDGTEEHSFYRQSKIFGVGSTEWSSHAALPPLPDLKTVNKPLGTNCDCHDHLMRIGRFGTWQKGVLTFHAYNDVVDALARMGVE